MSYLALVGVAVGVIAGFHYGIHRTLAPARRVERGTPADLGLDYRELHIPSEHGLLLYGWFVPAAVVTPVPAAVLVHGWGGNAETLLPLAPALREAGFAVVLFDTRCHGRSAEDSFASMPRFAEDIGHVIEWLKQQPVIDGRRIALVGHSVGAGAALLAASRRNDVAAVVSIAAFAHPQLMMRRLLASKHIPYWPLGWYIVHYVAWVIGHSFDLIAPVTTIHNISVPVLLLHGAQDLTVPVTDACAIYAARSGRDVQLHIIAGSHDEYGDIARQAIPLVAFLRDNLQPSSQG